VAGDRDISRTLARAASGLRAYLTGPAAVSALAVASMGGSPAMGELMAVLQDEGRPTNPSIFLDVAEALKTRRMARALTEVRTVRCGTISVWHPRCSRSRCCEVVTALCVQITLVGSAVRDGRAHAASARSHAAGAEGAVAQAA
jgi:hypothetical protein